MKKILFLLFIVFSFAGMAQETDTSELNYVISADTYLDTKRAGKILAMQVTDKHITTVRFAKKHIFWDVLDADMNKMFAGVIKKERNEEYLGHANTGNTIKLFTSLSKKNSSELTVFCYTFEVDKHTQSKKELFTSDYSNNEDRFNPSITLRRVLFANSPNHQFVAIAIDDYHYNRDSYILRVFDSNSLDLVYQTSYGKDKENYFELGDFTVNNAAEVFAIGKMFFKGRKAKRDGKINYEFTLHKITKERNTTLSIPVQTKLIKSLRIKEHEGKMSLVGFYADENIRDINGIFSAKINQKNLSLLTTREKELPTEVYKDLFRNREATRRIENRTGLPGYSLHDILIDSKGNTYLLANITKDSWSGGFSGIAANISTGGIVGETLVREYENMLICKLDASGEVLWGRGFEIKPLLITPSVFLKDDTLQLMITSDCNIKERKDGRKQLLVSFFGKSCLLHVVIAQNNELTFHTYPYRSTLKNYFEPSDGFYAEGIFVIPESQMKKKRFLKFY